MLLATSSVAARVEGKFLAKPAIAAMAYHVTSVAPRFQVPPYPPPPLILIRGCICTGTVVNTYLGVFVNRDDFKFGGGHHSALEESICGRQSPEQSQ
jgi:hypothetical protein